MILELNPQSIDQRQIIQIVNYLNFLIDRM